MPLVAAFGLKLLGLGRIAAQWLSRRSLIEIACIALALFGLVQTYRVVDARSDAARWEKQFRSASGELKRITSKQDRQKVITRDRIATVTKTIEVANDKAKKIEAAPLPGNCGTPKEVLQADI